MKTYYDNGLAKNQNPGRPRGFYEACMIYRLYLCIYWAMSKDFQTSEILVSTRVFVGVCADIPHTKQNNINPWTNNPKRLLSWGVPFRHWSLGEAFINIHQPGFFFFFFSGFTLISSMPIHNIFGWMIFTTSPDADIYVGVTGAPNGRTFQVCEWARNVHPYVTMIVYDVYVLTIESRCNSLWLQSI